MHWTHVRFKETFGVVNIEPSKKIKGVGCQSLNSKNSPLFLFCLKGKILPFTAHSCKVRAQEWQVKIQKEQLLDTMKEEWKLRDGNVLGIIYPKSYIQHKGLCLSAHVPLALTRSPSPTCGIQSIRRHGGVPLSLVGIETKGAGTSIWNPIPQGGRENGISMKPRTPKQ